MRIPHIPLVYPTGWQKDAPWGNETDGSKVADPLPLALEGLFLWTPKSCAHCLGGVWLCDPVDCSLPGSSVHGIIQARILEWKAISYSIRVAGWWPTVCLAVEQSHVCSTIASIDKMAQRRKQLWLSTAATPDMWQCWIEARALGRKCVAPAPSGSSTLFPHAPQFLSKKSGGGATGLLRYYLEVSYYFVFGPKLETLI